MTTISWSAPVAVSVPARARISGSPGGKEGRTVRAAPNRAYALRGRGAADSLVAALGGQRSEVGAHRALDQAPLAVAGPRIGTAGSGGVEAQPMAAGRSGCVITVSVDLDSGAGRLGGSPDTAVPTELAYGVSARPLPPGRAGRECANG